MTSAPGADPRAKKPGEGKTPLDDMRRILRDQRCWRASEKLVLLALRVLVWPWDACGRSLEELRAALPGREVERLLHTRDRVSAADLADMCGEGCGRRSVQRAIRIEHLAEVVVPIGDKSEDGKTNLSNHYAFDPQKLVGYTGKKRPESWRFLDKSRRGGYDTVDGGGYDTNPPPTDYAARAEAARLAAGRPPHDADFARLAKLARRANKGAGGLFRAEGRMAGYRERQAKRVAVFEAELAKHAPAPTAGPPAYADPRIAEEPPAAVPSPPPASSPPAFTSSAPATSSEPPSTPLTAPSRSAPAADLVEDDDRDPEGFTPSQRRAFDLEIMLALARCPPLALIANVRCAKLIGVSARKAGRTPEQAVEALERFAFKLHRGDYQAPAATWKLPAVDILKLARGYVKRQRPTVHAPITFGQLHLPQLDVPPAVPDPDEPTAEELAAQRDHFGLTAGLTPERIAELRATLEARLAFDLACDELRAQRPIVFAQWFSGVQYEELVEGVLSLRASNDFVREWVKKNFQDSLVAELGRRLRRRVEVAWSVDRVDDPIAEGPPPPTPRPRR